MTMAKRFLLAVIAVFVVWSVLDFIIHGVILQSTYQATAQLWRPMNEMKMGFLYVVTAVGCICFVGIYALLIQPKSFASGLKFGLLFGVGTGFGMGYGTYSVMPVPHYLALVWFVGVVAETVLGGLLTAAIVKPPKE
jgi:hypothetical protein